MKNCKFGWDDEVDLCGQDDGPALLDFSATHIIIIIIALILIVAGMCAGFIWNFRRKIREDKEELAAIKEARSIANSLEGGIDGALPQGATVLGPGGLPLPPQPNTPNASRSVSSRMANRPPMANPDGLPAAPPPPGGGPVMRAKSGTSHHTSDSNGGCYVPDGGFPFNSRI